MQPNPPSTSRPQPAGSGFSIGPGLIIGMIALFLLVYLVDQASKGEVAVFSGVDRRVTTQDFHGTGCTAIFGGCKIDLRDAQMRGGEAVLSTYAFFGGVEVRVPEDWEIVNRSVAIFGGVSENRRLPGASSKRLIVEGAALFGGVAIKD